MFARGTHTITIRDLLELDAFREGDAVVLAGQQHLDRGVRWVHISDLPTAAPSLKGGELLLTHGLGLRHSPVAQRRYVADLANVPIAGLVIELGRVFTEVPEVMVAAARQRDLPLVALRRRILFVNVTEQVHAEILNRQQRRLAEAQRVGRELMELAGAGVTVNRVLRTLAGAVANPVVLEDAAHQLVDFAPHRADIAGILETWDVHSRETHPVGALDLPGEAEPIRRCATAPIRMRNQQWGRLHVLEVDSPLPSESLVAAQHAASALTIVLLQDVKLTDLGRRASGSFVTDVLERNLSSSEIISRGRALRADLAGAVAVLALELDGEDAQQIQSGLERLAKLAEESLHHLGLSCLWRADGRRALLVVGAATEAALVEASRSVADRLRDALEGDRLRARLGLSEVTTAAHLATAFEHAREATMLASDDRRLSFASYAELGVDRLFVRLAEGPELASYVEAELGPLLEHDARHRSQLLPVLETYLETGGSKSEAARRLFMGRRSLYYKLDLIERLLDRSLDDGPTRSGLAVATRALAVLRRRSAGMRTDWPDPSTGG